VTCAGAGGTFETWENFPLTCSFAPVDVDLCCHAAMSSSRRGRLIQRAICFCGGEERGSGGCPCGGLHAENRHGVTFEGCGCGGPRVFARGDGPPHWACAEDPLRLYHCASHRWNGAAGCLVLSCGGGVWVMRQPRCLCPASSEYYPFLGQQRDGNGAQRGRGCGGEHWEPPLGGRWALPRRLPFPGLGRQFPAREGWATEAADGLPFLGSGHRS